MRRNDGRQLTGVPELMLSVSRCNVKAMLCVVLLASMIAIPNLLPQKLFKGLPTWAQHRVVPGIEFQGGSRLVAQADREAVHRERLQELRDEVRKVLREAKVSLQQAPVIRGNDVEVRVRLDADFERALSKLQELAWPTVQDANAAARNSSRAVRWFDSNPSVTSVRGAPLPLPDVVVNVDDRTIRLTLTEAAIIDRIRSGQRAAIALIKSRFETLGARGSVESVGNRVMVEVLGVVNLRHH